MMIFTRVYRRWLAYLAKNPVRDTTDEPQQIDSRATATHRGDDLRQSCNQTTVVNIEHSDSAVIDKKTSSLNSAPRVGGDSQPGDKPTLAQQKSAQKNSPNIVSSDPLPDPNEIEIGGSFARFLADDVDQKSQTSALQMLWKQPHYQVLDGLEQCDQDFSNQPRLLDSEKQQLIKQVYRHLVKDDQHLEEDESARCTADIDDGEAGDLTTDAKPIENTDRSTVEQHLDSEQNPDVELGRDKAQR
ncbi:DUF3306 domain-containing protein [Thalassotalea ponticola]|uniref:DUF3306 domain-containing protein n=1 Tax=Thalassotalea ponticola TaxID=1523392 RepID=UPI0025B2EC52|nr:DUF3306 domain-containing protein [Thalassotalea ponticola]MDN3653963.1 DUF3306 domain-containing protein [Thalassotalea ponticola]